MSYIARRGRDGAPHIAAARHRKRRKRIIPSERPVFGLPGEKSSRHEHVLREIFHPKGCFLAFRGKSPAGANKGQERFSIRKAVFRPSGGKVQQAPAWVERDFPSERPSFGLPGEKSSRHEHVLREIFHPKGRFLAFRGKSPAGAHASRSLKLTYPQHQV